MSYTETEAAPAAAPTEEELKAARLEVAKHNMTGSPMAFAGEPPEVPSELAEEAERAGAEIVQRYIPPPTPPTVIELLEAMKNPPEPPAT